MFRFQDDVDKAHTRLLLSLEDDDELVFDDGARVRGSDARRLARQTRRTRVRSTVEGEFVVQTVQSGQVRDGFRAKIRGVSSEEVLSVIISEGTLTESQIYHLQRAEWGKRSVHMTIDVRRVGEQIVRAEVTDLVVPLPGITEQRGEH